MHERLGRTGNVVLYECTKSLLQKLAVPDAFTWVEDMEQSKPLHSWGCYTRDVRELLEDALRNLSYERTLMPRLWSFRLLEEVAKESTREAELTQIKEHAANLEIALQDREARLSSILNSISWSVTAPLRGVGRLWMKRS